MCGISSNARRDCDSAERLAAIMKGKVFDCFANALYAFMSSLGFHFSDDEGKFFSAITSSQVSSADPAFNHSGNLFKQYVSNLVAERIVKMFEVIQIKHHHGNVAACSLRSVQFPVYCLLEISTV